MSQKKIILSVLSTVLLIGTALFMVFNKSEAKNNTDKEKNFHIKLNNAPSNFQDIHIYFADTNNSFLKAEKRRLVYSSNPAESGENILKMLIQGPGRGLMQTIPEKTKITAFYITDNATAYVDLSGEVKDNHPGGATTELLTIYSIVNSLILNIPEIKRVKILICGRESLTLAGHISLQPFFKANMLLIR